MVTRRHICILIGVICAVSSLTFAARVSAVTCSQGTECDTIDHSTCTSGTCQCSTGYVENPNDGSTCVQVFGSACTGNTACSGDVHSLCKNDICACAVDYEEKNGVCTQIVSSIPCTSSGKECENVPNSECDVAATKCKCSDGHVMNVDVCAAENAVLAVNTITCTASGKECENVPNAECDVAATKCKCNDGYVMNVDVCAAENAVVSVNTITCTVSGKECENVPNAECDVAAKKCKCSDGHVMNVNVCAVENAAATLRIGAATLLLLVILAVCN